MEERIQKYQEEGCSRRESWQSLQKNMWRLRGPVSMKLGISVDINADNSKCSSDAVYAWLAKNAHKYGFIKRYPSDKTEITGTKNEPWHYRYVGKKAAAEMLEKGLCLEEYIEQFYN